MDAEIDRMASKFQVGKDQWLKLLEKERGITPERYAQDIIWPTLALRELAKDQLQITRSELDEAYESEFGPGVKVRLIAIENPKQSTRGPCPGRGQAGRFRRAGQESFAGRQQRERLRPDPADSPTPGRSEAGSRRPSR